MTYAEYQKAVAERQRVISVNRSRRMRKGAPPPLPVPPKPARPLVPVAYEPDGTYYGRLQHADDCPAGYTLKMEPATW